MSGMLVLKFSDKRDIYYVQEMELKSKVESLSNGQGAYIIQFKQKNVASKRTFYSDY